MRPWSASCWRTRSGWASGRSILLTATIIVTFASLAWVNASTVCGITPSLAATTSTTMSVACAPRARLADRVEQRGLAVVDVTHDGDDRRPRHHLVGVVGLVGEDVLFLERDVLDLVAELGRE